MKTYPYWWEFYKPYHFQNTQVSNSLYDLVVVGAGYTGVNAAIQASSKGLKTLLIDQIALGEGASTRSAGMVSGGLNLGKKINLFKDYGEDLAKKFIQESIGSYEYLEDQINHHIEEVSYQKTGRLVLAHSRKKLDALRQKTNLLNSLSNLEIQIIESLENEINNNYYKGGMLVKNAASVNPAKLYNFFLEKALSNKVDIFSPCKLLSHQKIDEYYVLKTSEGKIKTQYLIIATNGYSEKNIGNEHYNIIGVPSYIAATNILGQEKVQKLLPKLRMYSDSKNDLYYFRPSPDHKRILFGAFPVWAYGMENSNMVKSFFYKKINLILPNIDNFSIDCIWGGKVGVTFNTLPMVKKTSNKVFVLGCNGSGVALMPYLGYQAANMLTTNQNSDLIISKIKNDKNYFKSLIVKLLPLLGWYYRFKENFENKFL